MAERKVPTKPKAREMGIVVRELPDEVLVYDLDTHKAVCLNSTAAQVWRLCDGVRSAADIKRSLEKSAGASVPDELVWLALEQLDRDKLLIERSPRPVELAGISRREMMRRVSLAAAITLPMVASIVAPTPAQAASLTGSGGGCTDGSQCQSGICNNGQCV